ncbi:MAG TPA: Flp pilus assembly protein CpaB [Bacillales bacterium]|nr:Flp pilus assembly protein CpaB [Bacillales bacterium]
MKPKMLFMLTIVMAAFTTFLFYRYMQQLNTSQASNANLVKIVVAKKEIKKNEPITADKLTFKSLPESAVIKQMVSDKTKVTGSYAAAPIAEGEPILTNHIRQREDEKLFVSRKLSNGYLAVSVGVNYVESVSNLIQPEDRVNVIASIPLPNSKTKQVKTEQIVSNVRVLAVGGTLTEPSEKQAEPEKYEAVTLELKPEDALQVIHASEQGDIQLVLQSRLLPNEDGMNDDS